MLFIAWLSGTVFVLNRSDKSTFSYSFAFRIGRQFIKRLWIPVLVYVVAVYLVMSIWYFFGVFVALTAAIFPFATLLHKKDLAHTAEQLRTYVQMPDFKKHTPFLLVFLIISFFVYYAVSGFLSVFYSIAASPIYNGIVSVLIIAVKLFAVGCFYLYVCSFYLQSTDEKEFDYDAVMKPVKTKKAKREKGEIHRQKRDRRKTGRKETKSQNRFEDWDNENSARF